MEQSGSADGRVDKKKSSTSRRVWSQKEDETLIQCFTDLINEGWKADNGFRSGYMRELEKKMKIIFPKTDICATPHINSKIHVWKRDYGSLASVLSKSGIGWNDTLKMIDVNDEATWEAQTKVDTNVRTMRYKSWPLYEDWLKIFGKDRATGDQAEDVMDAVNEMLSNDYTPDVNDNTDIPNANANTDIPNDNASTDIPFNMFNEELGGAVETTSVCQPGGSATVKKTKSRKRKSVDSTAVTEIVDALGGFLQNTESRLGELAQRIGYEQDAALSRKELFECMNKIEGLSLQQKLKVSDELVQNTQRLELFQSLPEDARSEFVQMLLKKLL